MHRLTRALRSPRQTKRGQDSNLRPSGYETESRFRWTTWGTVSSGFREIEIGWDRLDSVGLLAPFLAPAARSAGLLTGGQRAGDGAGVEPHQAHLAGELGAVAGKEEAGSRGVLAPPGDQRRPLVVQHSK